MKNSSDSPDAPSSSTLELIPNEGLSAKDISFGRSNRSLALALQPKAAHADTEYKS